MIALPSGFKWNQLCRSGTNAIVVAEEQDVLAESFSTLGGLDPLATSSIRPHSLDEPPGTAFNVGAVVMT